MTPIQKAKIQAFCQDKILSDTIREVFWDAWAQLFQKKNPPYSLCGIHLK